jgi:hypothetical protein
MKEIVTYNCVNQMNEIINFALSLNIFDNLTLSDAIKYKIIQEDIIKSIDNLFDFKISDEVYISNINENETYVTSFFGNYEKSIVINKNKTFPIIIENCYVGGNIKYIFNNKITNNNYLTLIPLKEPIKDYIFEENYLHSIQFSNLAFNSTSFSSDFSRENEEIIDLVNDALLLYTKEMNNFLGKIIFKINNLK